MLLHLIAFAEHGVFPLEHIGDMDVLAVKAAVKYGKQCVVAVKAAVNCGKQCVFSGQQATA